MDTKIKSLTSLSALTALADSLPEEPVVEVKEKKRDQRGPQYACFSCRGEFDKTGNTPPKKCSKCKSENIYKRWELLTADERDRKYSPDIEEQIAGTKQDKFFRARLATARRKKG